MFGVWQGTAPRRSHTNNTPCRSSAIFCHTAINPYDAVIGLWWHPWTNWRGSLFHWWKPHFLLSLKGSACAGMSSQVMAGSEPLPLCHARPQTHSFVRGYAPPCYFLNSHWVSTRTRWASACSRSWMKNQPGTHLLHLLSCLLRFFFFTPPSQNDFSFTWNFFFFFYLASCDFSRRFAAPRLGVLSRDVKYLLSHVSWTDQAIFENHVFL